MFLGEIIYKYRKENGLTMEEFAKLSGLSRGYISMLEKNKNPNNKKELVPTMATFKKAAAAMRIETDSLVRMTDGNQPVKVNTIEKKAVLPVTGIIKRSNDLTCVELKNKTYSHFDMLESTDVCLEIIDNVLSELNVYPGDKVFIRKNDTEPQSGRVYVVHIKDMDVIVFKRIYWQEEQVILIACCGEHSPIIKSVKNIKLLGKCIGIYKNI